VAHAREEQTPGKYFNLMKNPPQGGKNKLFANGTVNREPSALRGGTCSEEGRSKEVEKGQRGGKLSRGGRGLRGTSDTKYGGPCGGTV